MVVGAVLYVSRASGEGWPLVSSQGEPGALTVPNSALSLEPSIFRQGYLLSLLCFR